MMSIKISLWLIINISSSNVAISLKRMPIQVAVETGDDLPKEFNMQLKRPPKVFENKEIFSTSNLKKTGDLKVVGRGTGGTIPQNFTIKHFLNPNTKDSDEKPETEENTNNVKRAITMHKPPIRKDSKTKH